MANATMALYSLSDGTRLWQARIPNRERLAFVDMRLLTDGIVLVTVTGKSLGDEPGAVSVNGGGGMMKEGTEGQRD